MADHPNPYPRPPLDDEEREACRLMHDRESVMCLAVDGHGGVCNLEPGHRGDHIDALYEGVIVARWPAPSSPSAAPAMEPPPSPGGEDGTVGRFLAFAACQRDDTDRAICDAFYRAFVRLEKQIDDTQRRMDAGARAFERVCFARDRFAEQLEATIQRDNIEAQRIATIADEAFGPFPVQTSDENLTAIEHGIHGLRQRIGNLEAQREAVADVASEGDVEDLLDALDNLSADPKDGETWATRYQTAGALHAAWQDERQRRMQAEADAERWHRLFDEGATLTAEKDAQLSAASDRYARAVAEWDEVRGRCGERWGRPSGGRWCGHCGRSGWSTRAGWSRWDLRRGRRWLADRCPGQDRSGGWPRGELFGAAEGFSDGSRRNRPMHGRFLLRS